MVSRMAAAEQPHGSHRGTLDTLPSSSMQRTSSYHDKLVTISNRRNPAVPQGNGSWLPTRAILIIMPFVFSFILVLSRPRPSALWPESFFGSQLMKAQAVSHIPSNASSHEKPLPGLISTALSSHGRTDQVQWDNYTLILQGQRVLI
jgi:hypothetical protein